MKANKECRQDLVRTVFREAFNVQHVEDFAGCESVTKEDIRRFEDDDDDDNDNGPSMDALLIDMRGKLSSKWNQAVIRLLVKAVRERQHRGTAWQGLPERSDEYFIQLVEHHMKGARTTWRNHQPKVQENGELESPSDAYNRVMEQKNTAEKIGRAHTRRQQRFKRRVTVVQRTLELKKEEGSKDVRSWEWLDEMLGYLGEDGMSSDESDVAEETGETIYRANYMPWRRDIDEDLDLIDKQRLVDNDIYSRRGAKPVTRIRNEGCESRRLPVGALPKSFYKKRWLSSASKSIVDDLDISKTIFEWMVIRQAE